MHKSKPLQPLRHHRYKTSCEAEALLPSPAFGSLRQCDKSASMLRLQTFSAGTAQARGRHYKSCRRLKFSSGSFLKY